MTSRVVWVVTLVVVLCLGAVGAVAYVGGSKGEGSADLALDAGPGKVVLVLDGWSHAILGQYPTWGSSGAAREAAGWHSLTEDEARQLLADDPDTVADLMARTVVAVPVPECDADGCRSGSDELPLSYLTDPSSIPGYGSMYRAWGIQPVQVAQLTLKPGEGTVSVAAGESTIDSISVVAKPAPGQGKAKARPDTATVPTAPASTPLDETPGSNPEQPSAKAKARPNVVAVAAGFGTIFRLEPRWSAGEGDSAGLAYLPGSTLRFSIDPSVIEALRVAKNPLGQGLPVAVAGASSMPASMRTAFTSPTTGCLGAVICAPQKIEATVEGSEPLAVERCDTSMAAGFAEGASDALPRLRTAVIIRDETWSLDLPHPIAQSGAWGGKVPVAPVAGIWGPGPMPLYRGDHPLRFKTALVYSDKGNLALVGGQVFEVGVDAESAVNSPWGVTEALASLGDGRFVDCTSVVAGPDLGSIASGTATPVSPPSGFTPPSAAITPDTTPLPQSIPGIPAPPR